MIFVATVLMDGLVTHIDGMEFKCTANNTEFYLDDGTNGMTPMHLILLALATCISLDVIHILKKKRKSIDSFTVKIKGDRKKSYPKVFEKITLGFFLNGKLDEKSCQDAIDLSLKKYCSVSNMLKENIEITYSIAIT